MTNNENQPQDEIEVDRAAVVNHAKGIIRKIAPELSQSLVDELAEFNVQSFESGYMSGYGEGCNSILETLTGFFAESLSKSN